METKTVIMFELSEEDANVYNTTIERVISSGVSMKDFNSALFNRGILSYLEEVGAKKKEVRVTIKLSEGTAKNYATFRLTFDRIIKDLRAPLTMDKVLDNVFMTGLTRYTENLLKMTEDIIKARRKGEEGKDA